MSQIKANINMRISEIEMLGSRIIQLNCNFACLMDSSYNYRKKNI